MALIKCPECNREISNKAENCPHCGYPISKDENFKLYKIDIMCYGNDNATDEKLNKINVLLQEILGYTEKEVIEMSKCKYNKTIAWYLVKDITLSQAIKIAQPFNDWDIKLFLTEQTTEHPITWKQVGGLPPKNPKDHYYDEPIVSRDHLMDPFNPPQVERKPVTTMSVTEDNTPKCPTCQSTNIQKISGLERGASVFAWGLFSKKINKSFKCSNCGYTW